MPEPAREDEWPLPCIDHGIVGCEDCGHWQNAAAQREDEFERQIAAARSEAERETVQRIVARLRVDAEGCHGLGKYMAADTLFKAADAIDREFGGEDKGGDPRR